MLVYKQRLPVDTLDIAEFKSSCKSLKEAKKSILSIGTQFGKPVMWFQADSDDGKQVDSEYVYYIVALGTGHKWPSDLLKRKNYIGTVKLEGDTLVLHYFIVKNKSLQ